MSHPQYGITYSGYNLEWKTRKEAMTVAVDPKVIPLGSKIILMFDDPKLQQYNGVYTARDVGGGVKGKHIDLFMGDFRSHETSRVVNAFGKREARVFVIPKY